MGAQEEWGTSVDGGEKIIIVFFEFARMIVNCHTKMGFGGTSLHLDSLIRLFYATEADPGTGRVYYSCMESKEKRPEREAGGGGRGIAPSINVLPDGSFNVTQCISMYLNVTQCTSIYLNVPQSTLMYFKTL